MKKSGFIKRLLAALFFASLLTALNAAGVFAQTTEFSYQGKLTDTNATANGNFDFEFRLFDNLTGGVALTTLSRPSVPVSGGIFTVVLDFGTFPPADRFLEIAVRPSGGGALTTLAPRAKLLSTPYATLALGASLANNAMQLGGTPASQYVLTTDARLSDARSPLPNSSNYIQNRTTQQAVANFNISGNGTIGGTLTGGTVTGGIVIATTQYEFANNGRILAKFGQNNLYVGSLAGSANGGIQNTMVGDSAGKDTTGDQNAFFGFLAGENNLAGSNNTALGAKAGFANTTGEANTFVGNKADAGSANLTNATAVGASAFVEQSNALVLGSINGVNGATANTDVGIGVTMPARRLDVNGIIRVGSTTGTIGCVEDRDGTVIAGACASDVRFKKNITPFGSILNNFAKLRPVNYYWRSEEFADQRFGTRQSFGLIAQEVEELFPELVSIDEKGYKAVNYSKLPLLTIQAVGELKAENDRLKQAFQKQQSEIAELKKAIIVIQSNISKPKSLAKTKRPVK